MPGHHARPCGDLDDRTAIHHLVVRFYREIVFDEVLEPVFGETAEVDWAAHIPLLIDYWCRVLLGEPGYEGAILAAHRHVHDIDPLRSEHFDRWYALWVASIDARWAGPQAERAKRHAARVGGSLARQLLGTSWEPSERPDRTTLDATLEPMP
jgi:hemoglobin